MPASSHLLATVDRRPVQVVGDLSGLPPEVHVVRGAPLHLAHCHSLHGQPTVPVEGELHLLSLPRGQDATQGKDIKDLGPEECGRTGFTNTPYALQLCVAPAPSSRR